MMPAMSKHVSPQRLDAVLSALQAVREHVRNLEGEDIEVASYNAWIARLNELVEGDWDALVLDGGEDGTAPAEDMLMNIDAAIAFLDDYRATRVAEAG